MATLALSMLGLRSDGQDSGVNLDLDSPCVPDGSKDIADSAPHAGLRCLSAMEVRMDTKPLSASTWLLFAVVVVIATAIFLLVVERS